MPYGSHGGCCRLRRIACLDDPMILRSVGGERLIWTRVGTIAALGSLSDAMSMAGTACCSCAGRDRYARRLYVQGTGRSGARRFWGGKGVAVGKAIRGRGLGVSTGASGEEGRGCGRAVNAGIGRRGI